MLTISIIFTISSFIASLLVISAGMLSSRISQAQPLDEVYEVPLVQQSAKEFIPQEYAVEF